MSLRRRNSLSRGQGKFNRNEHLDIKGAGAPTFSEDNAVPRFGSFWSLSFS